MYKTFSTLTKILLLLLFAVASQKVKANINAIDFNKVNYPANLQVKIDFLRQNENIYNHWQHDWTNVIPKTEVVENLASLYTELDKISNKTVETDLLLGDIAHYLYNMEVETYFKNAVDNYKKAIAIAPKDYRVYWFLGNHYALSALPVLAINSFKDAVACLPKGVVNTLFWESYASAAVNANMPSTARYAAHQASIAVGQPEIIERKINNLTMNMFKTAPVDTTIKAQNLWNLASREHNILNFTNRLLGFKLSIDSTWKFRFGDYDKKGSFAMLMPNKASAQNGNTIGYSMLVMVKMAADTQTLAKFLDVFTAKHKNRKPMTFDVGPYTNCMAYEITDPNIYANMGGSHNYVIAVERAAPDYPGMLLEAPMPLPKNNNKDFAYYRAAQKYARVKEKLYYMILLDTCEDIHTESLAVFKEFLKNGITIE